MFRIRLAALGLLVVPLFASLRGASLRGASLRRAEQLDVGSFTLMVKEQRAGREQFSMRSSSGADGVALELRAESALGDRRAAMRLETDSAGTPVRYSLEERTGATITLRLGGQRVRGRFTTLARSTNGEAAREFLLLPGALVLEDNGVLQYALVVRKRALAIGDSMMIPTLTPVTNKQGALHVLLESGTDTVSIAGSRRAANRWQLRTERGERRVVWADSEGRLLRVQIPARGFEALRDDIPR